MPRAPRALFFALSMSAPAKLEPEVRAYLARSYPKNHTYRIVFGRLVPRRKLWTRDRRIRALYPDAPTSLVDLSACKGWFCLHAAKNQGIERVVGIELHAEDLRASRAAAGVLGLDRVRLEDMRLHQLAERVDEFGGPFDVVLVVNLYHYLFFGSRRSDEHYESHAAIFEMLRTLTARTLVFSNCTEIEQLPRHMQALAHEQGRAKEYSASHIREAAERYFDVEEHGALGKRPLWRLVPRKGEA